MIFLKLFQAFISSSAFHCPFQLQGKNLVDLYVIWISPRGEQFPRHNLERPVKTSLAASEELC